MIAAGWIETLLQDMRYASRTLRAHPGFTLGVLLSLTLGIGANTAIFSVVNAVLLRPLPYPEPDRLAQVTRRDPGDEEYPFQSAAKLVFFRKNCSAFRSLAAFEASNSGYNLSLGDKTEFVRGLGISADFFRVFGLEPELGRGFLLEEDEPNGPLAAVISHSLWQGRFRGDPALLGRQIDLSGRFYTVVGIMPAGFQFADPIDIWTALRASPQSGANKYRLVGRLKPEVSIEQAQSELDAVVDTFRRQFPNLIRPQELISVRSYHGQLAKRLRPALLLLFGTVLLVLSIACANTVNLLLARATQRVREVAIRLALGAGRARIVRQLITETVLLSVISGTIAILLAPWIVSGLLALSPPEYAVWRNLDLDFRVLAVTLVLSVVTGVAAGLAPALVCTRIDLNEAFKEGTGRATAGRSSRAARQFIVVSEIALCMVLVSGAVLLVRSFVNLLQVDSGFDPRHVLTARMSLNGTAYSTSARASRFYAEALARIRESPSVEAAAVITSLPLERGLDVPVQIGGGTRHNQTQIVDWRYITQDYFEAMRIRLLAGRNFSNTDGALSNGVAIVNQEFMRRYLRGQHAVGENIQIFRGSGPDLEDRVRQIVGVVADTKEQALDSPAEPVVFVPVQQVQDRIIQWAHAAVQVSWVVRTRDHDSGLIRVIQERMQSVDHQQAFSEISNMESVMARSVSKQRFQMLLITFFAIVALLLSISGIYGLISYSLVQRTQEFAIRMAIGATLGDIVRGIVWHSMMLAMTGVAIGLVTSIALARVLRTFVFGISPSDPLTLASVSALVIVITTVASIVPVLKLLRLELLSTLRG